MHNEVKIGLLGAGTVGGGVILVLKNNAKEIEKIPNYGVLLLPSVVALSQADRDAIKKFRQRGGSILSTWLTGVHTENGDWVGYDFMENVLGVKVIGNTQDAKDDNFIVVHGDNPVFHTSNMHRNQLQISCSSKNFQFGIRFRSRRFGLD